MTTLHGFCVKGKIYSQQAAHKDIPSKLDAVSETVSMGMIVYISITGMYLSFITFLRSCLMKFESTFDMKG